MLLISRPVAFLLFIILASITVMLGFAAPVDASASPKKSSPSAKKASNSPKPEVPPFKLPARYQLGSDGRAIEMHDDHTFRITSQVSCFRSPCPEAGGTGSWTYDNESRRLTLSQTLSPTWKVEQTWWLRGVSRDLVKSQLDVEMVEGSGDKAAQFPIPSESTRWSRVESDTKKQGLGDLTGESQLGGDL
ncbi:hypothetical protein BC828DRAFT_374720 [Blastocladiella britannica]|nr:hypothetical protein BC828DRAFT_374720 [Blastocladiella britannica]